MLGTFVTIRVNADHAEAHSAVHAAFACVNEVQREMSFHDPASDLSRLNRWAAHEPQPVPPRLRRVLHAALALARASDGRFDPTVGGRLVRSGHLPAPAAAEIDPQARWCDVQWLRDGRLHFHRPLWLDLGGIAKGYAVDCAVRALRRLGLRAGIVNAGGDLRAFGGVETIHVRDPARPLQSMPLLHVRDAAVATSSGYFSEIDGRSALVDPHGQRRLGSDGSVTVCCRRAIWADALTKIVLADPITATTLLRRLHASAMLLHRDGRRQVIT